MNLSPTCSKVDDKEERVMAQPQPVQPPPAPGAQQTALPARKVSAGALAGLGVTLVVAILNHYVVPDKPIPAEISALATTFASGLVSYFTPPGKNETTTISDTGSVVTALR